MQLSATKEGTIYQREAEEYVMQFLPSLTEQQKQKLGDHIFYASHKKRYLKEKEAEKKFLGG